MTCNMNAIEKYLLKHVIILVCCVCPGILVLGQVRFTASADKQKLGMDGYIQLQYSIDNASEVQQFTAPVFKNFIIVEGPTYISSTILDNGKLCPSRSFIYILQPLSVGSCILSPATAKVNGKLISSNSLSIEVVSAASSRNQYHFKGAGNANKNEQMKLFSDYILKNGEDLQDKIRRNLFIKVDVDKTTCFEGEPVVVTYKLYTRLKSESRVVRRPSFNGFSVYDMVNPESEAPSSEKWNGKEYNVYLIRKAQLYPLQTGALELDAAEVENKVSFLKAEYAFQSSPEALSNLLQSFVEDETGKEAVEVEKVSIASKPITIRVRALPEMNKPAGYDGAVGSFSIEAKINKVQIAMNDIATLGVTVRGAGNFGVMNAPNVKWPSVVETYEPKIREDFFKTMAPMRGSKTFQFTFMPKEKGDFSIPPVEISFFDPHTNKYRVAKTDTVHFRVIRAALKESGNIGKDGIATSNGSGELRINKVWILSSAAMALAFLGIFLFRQVYRKTPGEKQAGNEIPEPTQKAATNDEYSMTAIQLSPLFEARLMLIQQNSKAFYSELRRALWDFLNDKLEQPGNYLNKENIAEALRRHGFEEEIVDQFQLLIHQSEIALYTPDNEFNDMQSAYDLAEDLVQNINAKCGKFNP